MALFGKKNNKKRTSEPPIKFYPKNELPEFDEAMRELYIQTRLFVKTALDSRADVLHLALTAGGMAVQYVIDGISHPAPGMERDSGATVMAMLKAVAGLDLNNRTPLQKGDFEIHYRQKKYGADLVCQLSKNGEQVVLKFDDGTPPPANLEEAGMRPEMITQFKGFLDQVGFVLVSGPPKSGFTTTFNTTLRAVDRYVRNVVSVDDKADNEIEVENAPITAYDSKAGETPMTVLPKLLRTYPDVICIRKLADGDTVSLMCDQPDEERLVVGGIQANDAVEALLRIIKVGAPREKFAQTINASLNVRVVRLLCDHCKQAYAPPPQLLQKLGLPPKKRIAFYRPGPPPVPPNIKPEDAPTTCPVCNGIGYKRRSAIFELLSINDALRTALTKTNNLNQLREIAKKSGHHSLIEEGIVAAAKGMTSIQEVFRVLKGS